MSKKQAPAEALYNAWYDWYSSTVRTLSEEHERMLMAKQAYLAVEEAALNGIRPEDLVRGDEVLLGELLADAKAYERDFL